jgi:hypothetical protein
MARPLPPLEPRLPRRDRAKTGVLRRRSRGDCSTEVFERVKTQLAANTRPARSRSSLRSSLPLKGLVFDASGQRMGPTFAYGKAGNRHAYYVTLSAQKAVNSAPGIIARVSASALDALVLERMRRVAGLADAGWSAITPPPSPRRSRAPLRKAQAGWTTVKSTMYAATRHDPWRRRGSTFAARLRKPNDVPVRLQPEP